MPPPLSVETKLTDPRARPPDYATPGSAGMDLRACLDEPLTIAPGETVIVGTGVAVFIRDSGYVGLLAPRSGLGVKHGIVLANSVGIIDSDYQDEIRAALFNRGVRPYAIAPDERVCQLIFAPVARAELHLVDAFSEKVARQGGFGSTGRF